MKILTSQIPVVSDQKENVRSICDVIVSNPNSDWIIFPECAVTGWCQPLESTDYLDEIDRCARQYDCGVIYGTSHFSNKYQNVARILPRKNPNVYQYAKRWLAGPEHDIYIPGDQCLVIDEIAPLICNDFWATPGTAHINPYLPQSCARLGARVITLLANTNSDSYDEMYEQWHDINLRMWARILKVWVVVSNPSTTWSFARAERTQVVTGIIDPMGNWVARCPSQDFQTVSYQINL